MCYFYREKHNKLFQVFTSFKYWFSLFWEKQIDKGPQPSHETMRQIPSIQKLFQTEYFKTIRLMKTNHYDQGATKASTPKTSYFKPEIHKLIYIHKEQ